MRHHANGPSSLGRRYHCPGSLREERGLPETTSTDASEGTRLHAYTADVLSGTLSASATPEEYRELVGRAVDFATDNLGTRPGEHPDCEEFLSLTGTDGSEITHGTADAVHCAGGSVFVVDHKFGHKPLDEASATLQITAYVAAAMQRHEDADRGVGWLYQARSGAVYRAEVLREGLPAAVQTIEQVIARTHEPDAPTVAGEHCQYCRALGLCSTTQQATQDISELVPAALDATTQRQQKSAIVEEIRRWPAEKIAGLMPTVELARLAVDAVRSRLRECLEQEPDSVPGYRLRETNGSRSADALALFESLNDHISCVDASSYLTCCTVSVPKVEKLVGEDEFSRLATDLVKHPTIRKLERTRT